MQRLALAPLCAVLALAGAACRSSGAPSTATTGAGDGILFVRRPHVDGRPASRIFAWRPGSRARQVSPSHDWMDWPQWSPDGTLIAYAAFRGGWDHSAPYDIWTMRPNGTHPTQVTHEDVRGGDIRAVAPSWAPDGSQIVFTRQFADRPDALAVVSLHTRREHALHVTGDDPAWGRAGIAYAAKGGIMLLDPSSGHTALFAPLQVGVAGMAWSPRGELAVVEGDLGQHVVVYSGSGQRIRGITLPSPAAGTCSVSWSPSGTRLLLQVEEYGVLRKRLPRAQRPPPGALTGLWTVSDTGRRWRRLPIDAKTCNTSWR